MHFFPIVLLDKMFFSNKILIMFYKLFFKIWKDVFYIIKQTMQLGVNSVCIFSLMKNIPNKSKIFSVPEGDVRRNQNPVVLHVTGPV